MSLIQSPSVVTNGLVFYYDLANQKKSWIGAPTTNVIVNPEALWTGTTYNLNGSGYLYDATSAPTHSLSYDSTVARPIGGRGILRYNTGANTGYKYWAVRGYVPSAGTYTFSYYARLRGNNMSAQLSPNQLWRDTGTDKSVSGDWNPTYTTEWKRYTTTGYVTTYLDYFPVHGSSVPGGYELEMCGFQLEAGSVASTFVVGTRSNTQAIKDLSNSVTVTANNLTYNSDNTFEWAGTGQYLSYSAPEMYSHTIEFVVYNPGTQTFAYPSFYQQYGQQGALGYAWIYLSGNSSTVTYQFANGTTNALSWANAVPANTYTHLAFVANYLTQTVSLYKNGELMSSQTSSNIRPIPASTAYVGNYQGQASSSYDLKGKLPIYRVYKRALSSAEVQTNFNSIRGRYGL